MARNRGILHSVLFAAVVVAVPGMSAAGVALVTGSEGDGSNQILGHEGVARDAAGNVYVAGSFTDNVIKIEPNGTITEIIDASGDGTNGLATPVAIDVDDSGNVWVAGRDSDNLFKIEPDGTIVQVIGREGNGEQPLDGPTDVLVGGFGAIFVTGFNSDNVFVVHTAERYIGPETPHGYVLVALSAAKRHRIDGPRALARSGNSVPYIVVASTHSRNVVDSAGRELVSAATLEAAGIVPESIATVSNSYTANELFVTGPQSSGVYRWSRFGDGGVVIDTSGDGSNALVAPTDLAVDGAGNLYVTGGGSNNGFRVTPDGVIEQIFDGSASCATPVVGPAQIAVVSPAEAYVTAASDALFLVRSTAASVSQVIDGDGDGVNQLRSVRAVAGDASGNIYVAGHNTDNVFKVRADCGGIEQVIGRDGDGVNELRSPANLAVDGAGNVYVAGRLSANVFKVAPSGEKTVVIDAGGDGSAALASPEGLAVSADGTVYVTGAGSNNAFRVPPVGPPELIFDAGGDGSTPVDALREVALDASGNVYLASTDNGVVFKVTPAGAKSVILDRSGDGTNPLLFSDGIAAAPDGTVYVADSGTDSVFKVTPSGDVTRIMDAGGDGVHALDSPWGIAVDPLGNVLVSAFRSSNAFLIEPSGAARQILGPDGDGVNGLFISLRAGVAPNGDLLVAGTDSNNAFRIATAADRDGDNVADSIDNCPDEPNPDQRDSDFARNTPDSLRQGDVCDPCPAPGGCVTDGTIAGTVGPGGGTLTTPNGELTLEIPAGALASQQSISMTRNPTVATGASRVYQFLPDGVTFSQPVTLTVSWSDADDDGLIDDTDPPRLETGIVLTRNGLTSPRGIDCELLSGAGCTPESCCDTDANTLIAQTTRFSEWRLGPACGLADGRRTRLRMVGLDTEEADDKLKARGFLGSVLLGAEALASIDPATDGVRVLLTGEDEPFFDVTIAGGAFDRATGEGWKTKTGARGRRQWIWRDKSPDVPASITRLRIADPGEKAPGELRFGLQGRRGDYDPDATVGVTIQFSGGEDCVETAFWNDTTDGCVFSDDNSRLDCRGVN